MKKLVILASAGLMAAGLFTGVAEAKSKKPKSSAQVSDVQRKRMYDAALRSCRKEYGDHFHRVEMDYPHGRYYCWHY
jgi:hypothetical protein